MPCFYSLWLLNACTFLLSTFSFNTVPSKLTHSDQTGVQVTSMVYVIQIALNDIYAIIDQCNFSIYPNAFMR